MTAFTVTTSTFLPAAAPKPRPAKSSRAAGDLQSRYDAAQTTDDNKKHWSYADDLSANAANSVGVRRLLRRRARYEAANNPNIGGLVRRISRNLIGTGPRLQLRAGDTREQRDAARLVEKRFKAWTRASKFARKLRVLTAQKVRDGEGFAVLVTNRMLRNPVKLDLRLIEPEQVTTPDFNILDRLAVDGIRFDKYGNPVEYHVLKYHPGDGWAMFGADSYEKIPAGQVIHWFYQDRAGQARGVSELAPMLPLAAYQRRYVLATVAAAETAANIAGIIETDLPAGSDSADAEGYDRIDIERNALMTLAAGQRLKQFEAEQPTSSFKEFNGELLNMQGQAVNAPANVMSGNSSGYNFSSGRLDHMGYHSGLWVDRDEIRDEVIDPTFREWLNEAVLAGEIPDGLPPIDEWEWDWHWDGFGSIDPVKDAEGAAARMGSRVSTLAEECAAEGKDWREVLAQQAAETAEAIRLGVPDPHAPKAATGKPTAVPADTEEVPANV